MLEWVIQYTDIFIYIYFNIIKYSVIRRDFTHNL